MRGRSQPYPNEPQVRDSRDQLYDLQDRAAAAMLAMDEAATQRLLQELESVRARLGEVTAALVRNNALAPQWVEHTEADAEDGAIPCAECGNTIFAEDSHCSYCGWTYLVDSPSDSKADSGGL